MDKRYKYIRFDELEAKTKQFAVKNSISGELLGYVKWYAQWRKYCFFIEPLPLLFDTNCLAEIQGFINTLMSERRKQ